MKLNMPFFDFAAVLLRERLVPTEEIVVWIAGMLVKGASDMTGGGGGAGGSEKLE